ncbi:hypothetical protein CFK41_11540 [Brachybacterium ginsengisoli]|uniref:Uncharacterized protein n=1 Tax=Brachybacterium ginsengisoli TaxID=1331682 RepID=A0A291GYP2_9MICO|nr:hypothetical protein CFK41_11540 [Brachybacterium ginsengisoli]
MGGPSVEDSGESRGGQVGTARSAAAMPDSTVRSMKRLRSRWSPRTGPADRAGGRAGAPRVDAAASTTMSTRRVVPPDMTMPRLEGAGAS